MRESGWLVESFEGHRGRLKAVAYRMLRSSSDADDAVQEAWIRFSRSDTSAVADLGGWLTTVVSRVCLNILQGRRSRPEVSLDPETTDAALSTEPTADPEEEAMLADSIGAALLVVLETLTPAERVAFVLHDMFAVPFDEIGPIVGRSAAAARQLASRARRRVQGRGTEDHLDGIRHARLVDAFLAAARQADFHGLLAVLDPDIELRADAEAVKMGANETRGANAVAAWFSGRASGARPALVNGRPGAVWMPGGQLRVVFKFRTSRDRIVAIDLIANSERIREMTLGIG